MDFIDEVRTRSDRFAKRLEHFSENTGTEEATKTSFVLPFIQMLGYDIFNPVEVVPEYTADTGIKKGEKVDYALFQKENPVILIECKKLQTKLEDEHVSQLFRYFGVTKSSRIGILTNGTQYKFYSDLDHSNVMDGRPFFEFDMLDFTELQVKELKRFTKDEFDTELIVDAARELKYASEIKRLLEEEFSNPSDEFVKFVIKRVYEGRVTGQVREMFTELTISAFSNFINDKLQRRLTNALKNESESTHDQDRGGNDEQENSDFSRIELDGLLTIKAILGGIVQPDRLSLRKAKFYCSIVLHSDGKREDYGTVIFRLKAKVKQTKGIKIEAQGFESITVDKIDQLFSHADNLRNLVLTNYIDSSSESNGAPQGQ